MVSTRPEYREPVAGRTGILTLHYGFNEGAILQAYALSELLRSTIGGAIEIVDQRYPAKLAAYGDAGKIDRTRTLSDAIDEWLPLSADRYQRTDSTQLIRELGERYECLVFGSDVLWGLSYRTRFRGLFGKRIWPKQKSRFFPAFPNVYWPSATQRCRKLVFSASIGTLDWKDVPARHLRMMREGLESCSAVSVRDERTMDFVSRLSQSLADRVRLLADPTFARPFREIARLREVDSDMKQSLAEMGVDFNRRRCLVIAKNGEASSAIVERIAQLGWQTVSVTTPNDLCSLRLHDHGFHPLAWARLFDSFDLCVTERMHGAIFSLLNNTPFLAIEMNKVEDKGMTKASSLLRRFDLEDVLLDADEKDPNTLHQTLERVMNGAWDWQRINKQIEAASDQQLAFLNDGAELRL